ncbi:MAG TPA: succinate dehydrogenase cytochrome b subunit [Geobacteraceae bacterium]|nr:succinate dehydrogenase cytochrome b subunit [Geobacteraceae bacterium]
MQLFTSTVGRKILMALTGILMVLFVVVHLLGNSSIFIPGGINAYAEHLHALPPLVWIFRLCMLVFLGVHVIYGIQLTMENSTANPQGYAVKKQLKANFSSENMIWTGVLLLIFIIGHICHFTAHLTPDIVVNKLPEGGNDVFTMVVSSFNHPIVAFLYVAAMVVLFLHLKHGIQSFFQTVGWNNDRTLPVITKAGVIVAVFFLLGYSSIPLSILTGILSK